MVRLFRVSERVGLVRAFNIDWQWGLLGLASGAVQLGITRR